MQRNLKADNITNVKLKTQLTQLCSGINPVFLEYMRNVKNLGFTEAPNYDGLIDLFKIELANSG